MFELALLFFLVSGFACVVLMTMRNKCSHGIKQKRKRTATAVEYLIKIFSFHLNAVGLIDIGALLQATRIPYIQLPQNCKQH